MVHASFLHDMYIFIRICFCLLLSGLLWGILMPACAEFVEYDRSAQRSKLGSDAKVFWCASSLAELKKCADLLKAIDTSVLKELEPLKYKFVCILRTGKPECASAIENGEADITTMEAGELFFAGNLQGIIPIAIEESGGRSSKDAVVLIRRNTVSSIGELRNRSLCSPSATSLAGFTIPVTRLVQMITSDESILDVVMKDCNSLVKTAADFFGPSCVPDALSRWINPRADNPVSLCQRCSADNQCISDFSGGNDGALNCLVHGTGDVAFLSADIALKLPPLTASEFGFLCVNGRTAPLTTASVCSWGSFPGNAFVTSSSKSAAERTFLQQFIFNLTKLSPQIHSDRHPQSGERKYNGTDLMWSDALSSVRIFSPAEQNVKQFLGPDLFELAAGAKLCPFQRMRFCVTGPEELEKCQTLQTALSTINIKPDLICILARNHWDCMQRISSGYADVMAADAADTHLAGRMYGLIPFMHEIHDDPEPFFYAVAVVKRTDLTTSLLDLRGRRTCHGQVYGAVGWAYPINFLITQHRVRLAYDCQDLAYQISQIFEKACAPGALNTAHYRSVMHLENLCDLCMGDGENYCARNPSEPYFGSNGAFKCLAEGGGHVAFVPHGIPRANTDGRNMRTWSRALVSQDYQLLCTDGTRGSISDFKKCNIGRVPTNALLTARSRGQKEVESYILLLDYAQKYFGSTMRGDDFSLFQSYGSLNQDLIFSDATTRLLPIPLENRSAESYLGEDFIRLLKRAQCAGAARLGSNFLLCEIWVVVACMFHFMFNMQLYYTNDSLLFNL
ncbi:LOW QUALITY PROTEIN: melanotransferrin-like [Paramacrobiotus metropolitanus]|uniref:LOW QUALITY PROTEIN: melanotransferrin-like n=1 Tax=Paramacrobiotus metropolitanus TaxID=2943436 RepID=UPI002445956E|nr:LOW QUALITY PROTEIN: melanotransferrin-like [Paramacrobiotus metropolitanus]